MTVKELAKVNNDLYRTVPNQYSKPLTINLKIPPSVNHLYYNTRGGGRRLTATAERYMRDSRALLNMAVEDQGWSIPEQHVWQYIDMVYYFPDRKIRDASNCLKILLDAMESIVYVNDMYALPRIMSVEYDKHNPRVEITVHAQTPLLREMYTNGTINLS